MANQSKLKAWVRYDGTNTVVTAGPIFRAAKPKVGNWRQINADLCCNGGSTTTTTTTAGGGTATAYFGQIANQGPSAAWAWNACNGLGSSIVVYTNSEIVPFPAGTPLYSDAALTTLIPYAIAALSINGTVYEIQNGYTNPLGGPGQSCSGITTSTTTTSDRFSISAVSAFTQFDACAGAGSSITLYYSGTLGNGTSLWLNESFTMAYNPAVYGDYVRLYFNAEEQVCLMQNNMINSYVPCYSVTT